MDNQKVGSIYYECTVDTAGLVAGQREADKSVEKLNASLTSVAQATKVHVAATQMAAAATRDAAKAATDSAAAHQKLADAEAKAAAMAEKFGISTGQYKNAMRGIPAQMTDIVTGLANGQAPMTVLMQQGGQLKDTFFGIGNAAKALGSYVLELINPFTVAAAAVGAFVYGLVQGSKEMTNFKSTLILTGNASGVTADQLNTLAERFDSIDGVTRGQAAEALNIFAQAGLRGQQSIAKFTEAAIRLEQVGGPSIEKTAAMFKDLENDPVKALLKLNETFNFLTDSTYKQVKALEDQGLKIQAAKVAQDAFADAILNRAPKILEDMGTIERGWRAIWGAVKDAGDAVLSIGRSTPLVKQLSEAQQRLNEMQSGGRIRYNQQSIDAQQKIVTSLAQQIKSGETISDNGAKDAARRKASAQFDQAGEKFLDKRTKMERDILAARQLGAEAGESDAKIQQRIVDIRKSYEEKGPSQLGKAEAAQAYYQGLVADSESAMAKIDASEQKALLDNASRMARDAANSEIYEKAKVAIADKYARQRALLQEKTTQEIAELDIAMTTNAQAQIEKTRAESVRRAMVERSLGQKTPEQTTRSIQFANFQAQQQLAELTERDNKAKAETALTLTKSQEQQIIMMRTETLRQTQDLYARDRISLDEKLAADMKAYQQAEDQIKALKLSRTNTQVNTLQVKAQTTGNPDDQIALVKAQADASVAAMEEARQKDLEQTQIYEDAKVAIRAQAAQQVAEITAASTTAEFSMMGSAAGQLYSLLQQAGLERTALARAAFLAEKAFAVATIIMNTEVAASKAGAQLGIFGIPMATVIRATGYASAAMVAGTAIGQAAGGRQYGGPTEAGSLYKVNETGAPEMFMGSNGSQYMMPNKSGSVVPADKVGGGAGFTVNVHNAPPGTTASIDQSGRIIEIAVAQAESRFVSSMNSRTGGHYSAITRNTNVRGRL